MYVYLQLSLIAIIICFIFTAKVKYIVQLGIKMYNLINRPPPLDKSVAKIRKLDNAYIFSYTNDDENYQCYVPYSFNLYDRVGMSMVGFKGSSIVGEPIYIESFIPLYCTPKDMGFDHILIKDKTDNVTIRRIANDENVDNLPFD